MLNVFLVIIRWENLDISLEEKCLRGLCVFILVFLLLIITFAIIIAANIAKPTSAQHCPRDRNIELEEAINTKSK